MNHYEFCVQWILDSKRNDDACVLDYGCGAGHIIKELRRRGVNAFGCDVFYEGGDFSKDVDPALFGTAIRRMEGSNGVIPFGSASFDIVINNQVMEHVGDLDGVLAEIQRVLRPGGMVLSLFPDKGVWREGHCGIPFLHWFPKGSRGRIYYAAALRMLGFGYQKGTKSTMRWSRDFCEWLDKWSHYRSRREIDATYRKYFSDLRHVEDYFLQLRLGRRKALAAWLPRPLQQQLVRKLGGLVFVALKPA